MISIVGGLAKGVSDWATGSSPMMFILVGGLMTYFALRGNPGEFPDSGENRE